MSYPIPASVTETLYEIKKSKFYACAGFAPDRAASMALLEDCKNRYPDARHHCWAYLLGSPKSPASAAMSDDGEPSGTAGKPILNVLQHKDIGDIMLVVTRYFGGVKLGAGGLVRAYSASAQQTIDALSVKTLIQRQSLTITADFKHEQFLRHWIEQHDGTVDNCDYNSGITLLAGLPEVSLEELKAVCGGLGINIRPN